jgi:hypothetical protein
MPIRRKITALLVTVLAAVGWAALAAPAHAGGPTSVLMVNPATGRTNALYYTNKAYERLANGVGVFAADSGSDRKPPSVSDDFDGEIRLTWMIHDMSIWRIDRVHVTGHDGTWIETLLTVDGGDVFSRPGRWHRAADHRLLMASLTAAGLLAGSQRAAGDSTSTMPSAAVPTVVQAAPTAVQTAPAPVVASSRTPVAVPAMIAGAGAAGLVVGAVAALALARPRTRPRSNKPRRVLLTG